MKQEQFKPGWLPGLPDERDFKFAAVPKKKEPSTVDLSAYTGPVLNQGTLGSCTANAIAAAIYHAKEKQGKQFAASRLFIYYNERVLINTVNEDSGAYIRDGFKTINKYGAPEEMRWPYIIDRFKEKPSSDAYRQALENQSIRYYSVSPSSAQVKGALIAGFPVVFGFMVFDSFFRITKSKPTMQMPKKGEVLQGGHAVIAVGYSNRRKAFKIQNSWGTKWGDKGFFWMPYAYLDDTDYTADFWVLETTE